MKKATEITNEISTNSNTQVFLFKILISLILALSVLYIYMIGSITFNVIARKSLENTSRLLSSNISQLELDYLSNANQLNKSYASTIGFVDAKSNIFAVRDINYVAIR